MATLAPLTGRNASITPDEFEAMLDAGEFDGWRVEYLDGRIVINLSHGRLHLSALMIVQKALYKATFDGILEVASQGTIRMGKERPEPDLSLVDYDPRKETRRVEARDVRLAIEIAVSSLARDRREKGLLYASQGIPEYWIVNPEDRQIEVYREPSPDGYRSLMVAAEEDTISALALPGSSFRVADLMPVPDPEKA